MAIPRNSCPTMLFAIGRQPHSTGRNGAQITRRLHVDRLGRSQKYADMKLLAPAEGGMPAACPNRPVRVHATEQVAGGRTDAARGSSNFTTGVLRPFIMYLLAKDGLRYSMFDHDA